MNTTNFVAQWAGAAFMLGSLLFLVNKLNEMSRLFFSRWLSDVISGQDTLLIFIGQVAFIIGYVGFWQLYANRVGRWGKNALRLFCGGGIVLAIGHTVFMTSLGANLPPSLRLYGENLFLLVLVGLLGLGLVMWLEKSMQLEVAG